MPIPQEPMDAGMLNQVPFKNTAGDFWFHIKSENRQTCSEIANFVKNCFEGIADQMTETEAGKRPEGKVIAERFRDAMINPVDPVNFAERILVGREDAPYEGSSFVLQQKFQHNWQRLDAMTMIEKENMIGRNHDNTIIPQHDDRSHIKCVRQLDGQRVTQRIMRQAVPFGQAPEGGGREEGIYFVAYSNAPEVFADLIMNIVGDEPGFVKDALLSNSHSISGNLWFIPCTDMLQLPPHEKDTHVPLNDYFDIRSNNGVMFYNNRDFLHKAQAVNADGDPISDRIIGLLGQTFMQWNDTWTNRVDMPSLGRLQDYTDDNASRWHEYGDVGRSNSAALRKGLTIKISLSDVLLRPLYRETANLFTIKPNEIIVGNMPPLTLGSGSRVMEYLQEDERIQAFFGSLNEYSSTGHNIPDYHKVLRLGIPGLLNEARTGLDAADQGSDQAEFYQSVVWALEGVEAFIHAYAGQARALADNTVPSDALLRGRYLDVAERMERLVKGAPDGFLDGLQLIFIVNCALHQVGEPMSIGRLDQYLIGAYEKDVASGCLTPGQAQEMIDAFWLKLDETVLYNRQFMPDYLNYGTGAVFYSAGNFPQGSALNQWVQQVTVGGYLPTDDEEPRDGCNALTLLCLKASRRLPLNAPCLSLRVHDKMDTPLHEEILEEAARSIRSGGAHPILLNDDKFCPALHASGPLSVADSRDYVCDGCYEPVILGKSEWAFSYVPILPVVGMAMNEGATFSGAGWVHLHGMKTGWNSPPPEEIKSFEDFLEIFYRQYSWQIHQFFNTLMSSYGSLGSVCPSPLFSSMLSGCLETGRDMTNGGADYHIVAPMMCGITNAINALYSIKSMCYDPETSVTTLSEMRQALWTDWGQNMKEPFHNVLAGVARAEAVAARYKDLRQHTLGLPKFGEGGNSELKAFAESVVSRCVDIIHDAFKNPLPATKAAYEGLQEKYGLPGKPFAFTITPGVGTFEDNLGLGATMAASADGRLGGAPIADDFCPAPSPSDAPPTGKSYDILASLDDWNVPAINIGLANGSPADLNIAEDFSQEDLVKVIRAFAKGETGPNLLTITTADIATYQGAQTLPEKFDLVRVRQGGWSEFYAAMFPEHQDYIIRRRYYHME